MAKQTHVTLDRTTASPTTNPLKDSTPRWLSGWYPLIWFSLAEFLLYAQSLPFGWSYLDDTNLLLNRMELLRSPRLLLRAFGEDVFGTPGGGYYYRPLLTVSFVIDATLGGGNLAMFRFSNLVYHILATWLLFRCFSVLNINRGGSFLLSMLFLLHPAVTQAVAWVPGRNDILLAIFILASFLYFIRYLATGSRKHLALHLGFWLLGLLTKETAFLLPFLLLPASWWLWSARGQKILLPLAGYGVLAAAWFLVRATVLSGQAVPVEQTLASLWRNLPAVLPFLGKSLIPAGLSVFPVLADMIVPGILGVVALGTMVTVAVASKKVATGYSLLGIAWFLIFLVPTFIKHTSTPDLTEHRLYLPLAGVLLFVLDNRPVRTINLRNSRAVMVAGALAAVFFIASFVHIRVFSDRFSFWNNAVQTSPSHAYNYNTLGAMYFMEGDLEKASGLFSKALELNPGEFQANGNMGLVLMQQGRVHEAAAFYRKEIAVNPGYDNVYYNYGLLFYNQGKTDSALLMWEKTVEVNPRYVDAYQALIQVYRDLGRQADLERIGNQAMQQGLTK